MKTRDVSPLFPRVLDRYDKETETKKMAKVIGAFQSESGRGPQRGNFESCLGIVSVRLHYDNNSSSPLCGV